jgi:3-oxoacyl-[acyl-carrier-protein] synthase III
MIGIEDIAVYIPSQRVSNLEVQASLEVDEAFLRDKIGVTERAIRAPNEDTSDLACEALQALLKKTGLAPEAIDVLGLVTQNPDTNLPHVSAIVHGRAGLRDGCAAFDISLGCSGYVYGLSILQSFMATNGMRRGVLVTADPYSKIVDPADRNTVLLFGDAATATLISQSPRFVATPFTFGTRGALHEALICRDGVLVMNGREIFNFAAKMVPADVTELLTRAKLNADEVDAYIFHQGSRYIVETIAKRLRLDATKVRSDILSYGNTVSSSIPILLAHELNNSSVNVVALSGFGVGLSWASCILRRVKNDQSD